MRTLWRRVVVALAAVAAVTVPAVLAPTAAQAAWGTQISFSLQVNGAQLPSGGQQQLGYAEGWVQFDDGGDKFRYEFLVCRQSSFTTPHLGVHVNVSQFSETWVTNEHPTYSGSGGPAPCYGQSGVVDNEHTHANFWNVRFTLHGDTMIGATYTTFTRDATLNNPY